MKNLLFVGLVVVFAFVPVFMSQVDGTTAPIAKVEVQEQTGIFNYEGATKGVVTFDHNMHVEVADKDCSSCHAGESVIVDVSTMSTGHGLCSSCHEEVDDMKACTTCHSK